MNHIIWIVVVVVCVCVGTEHQKCLIEAEETVHCSERDRLDVGGNEDGDERVSSSSRGLKYFLPLRYNFKLHLPA